jgi:hypothetical protein
LYSVKTKSLTLQRTQKSVHPARRGDCLRGTTRLRCARVSATSRSDFGSDWLDHDGQSTEPTRTRGSFGQQLRGDLRRCHRSGLALSPARFARTTRLLVPFTAFALSSLLPCGRLVQPRHTPSDGASLAWNPRVLRHPKRNRCLAENPTSNRADTWQRPVVFGAIISAVSSGRPSTRSLGPTWPTANSLDLGRTPKCVNSTTVTSIHPWRRTHLVRAW